MNRADKIKLLQELQAGKDIDRFLPVKDVLLLEVDMGYLTDFDAKRIIPITSSAKYLELVRKENEHRIVRLTIVYNDEYKTISTELENQY